MSSQHQYQLDNEYRNRQMAQAENARLAEEAQSDKPKRNLFGAIINAVQRIASSRPQPQIETTAPVSDTKTITATS